MLFSILDRIKNYMGAATDWSLLTEQLDELLLWMTTYDSSIRLHALYKQEGAHYIRQAYSGDVVPPKTVYSLIHDLNISTSSETISFPLHLQGIVWGYYCVVSDAKQIINFPLYKSFASLLEGMISSAYQQEQLIAHYEVSRILGDRESIATLFPLLLQKISKMIGFHSAQLAIISPYYPSNMEVHVCSQVEGHLTIHRPYGLSFLHSHTQAVLQHKEVCFGGDIGNFQIAEDANVPTPALASVMRLPLFSRDVRIGTLHFYSDQLGHYTDKEATQLQQWITQFIPSIHSMYQQEQYVHASRLQQLSERFSTKLISADNIHTTGSRVSRIAEKTLHMDHILIWFVDEEEMFLRSVNGDHLHFSFTDSDAISSLFIHKKTVHYNGISGLSWLSYKLSAYDAAKSVMLCPILDLNENQTIGIAMLIDNCNPDRFNTFICGLCDEVISPKGGPIGNKLKQTRLTRTNIAMIKALTIALDKKDAETQGHSERVVLYSLSIAKQMGLNEAMTTTIRWGALLHDIGKIGIPDAILLKPDKLHYEEWKVMKTHPLIGFEMLRGISFIEDALDIVLYHHERADGLGYPHGIGYEQIPLGAKIFAIADAFDAITSDRPYRKAQSIVTAREIINESIGSQFCPVCAEAFLHIPLETLIDIRDNYLYQEQSW